MFHELPVGACFHQAALLQDQDAVGIGDGREPVSDDHAGPPLRHAV